jgi:cytochrome c553
MRLMKRSVPLVFRTLWSLGTPILLALATAVEAASIAQQEYESVLASKPDSVQGERLFETCAACHGPNGAGIRDGTIPAIAGQPFRVVARQLVDFRHEKRWDELMQHFTSNHHLRNAQDIADVSAYVSGLSVTHPVGQGSGEQLERAATLYAQLCASCHGPTAQGDQVRGYPRLAGQHYVYVLRQLDDGAAGRRPNFSTDHIRLISSIGHAELSGIADYLSRLEP